MALGDHIKNVIYGTIATTLSAGVIAVILWLKGLPLHRALLVTAGFILAVSIAAYLISVIIENVRKSKTITQDSDGSQEKHKQLEALSLIESKLLTSDHKLTTRNAEFDALESKHKLLRTQINNLKEELATANSANINLNKELARQKSLKDDLDQSYGAERQAAIRIKTLIEQCEKQIEKLNQERLAAASNLQGVESDRNNFRAWYYELAWLNPAIEPQKKDISNFVKVIAARPCLLNLKERVAVVDLVIRNDSFFDLAIKPDDVGGRFATKKGLLHDPAKALIDLNHPAVEKLKPREEATVTVIQPLLRSEAEEIEDAISEGNDGRFWLGNLNIPVSVQNAKPLQVDSKPLRIDSNVEHVYFREFGGLTFDGELITPQDLVRDIDALPFPERLRIYQEMSNAYGESLWRLNEARQSEDREEIGNEAIKPHTNSA